MSRENVEIVRRQYANSQSLLDSKDLRPDAQFDFTDLYPDQPVIRGVAAMRRFRDDGPWGRSTRFAAERYFDVDEETVLVFTRVTSTGQGSGATLDTRVAQRFTVRNGLITRVKVYADRQQAVEAVGLAE